MDTIAQDLRFAVRSLGRTPGLALAILATLALCIGATTSIFSVVHAVLFRPLPYADPDGLLYVHETYRGRDGSFSVGNWADVRRDARHFHYLVPTQTASVNLAGADAPENIKAARVGWEFFAALGVAPALGRGFREDEDRPGRDNVVVLTDRLWRSKFGADPAIIGRDVRVDGRPRTVVGVMPRALDVTFGGELLWLPAAFTPAQLAEHDEHFLTVIGRLAPGTPPAVAQAELDGISRALRARYPLENNARGIGFRPLVEEMVGDYRARLYLVLGAVGFVLLVACANIAGLLLARSASRAREIAIRTAMGAGRSRIIRQALTEAALLAAAGGLAGVVLAYWGVGLIAAFGPADLPRLAQARLDGPVLTFAGLLTVSCGLLCGFAPALRMASRFPVEALKEGGRAGSSAGRDRLRSALVIGEIALALVLLTGAGLLIRSAVARASVDPGFDPRDVVVGRISLPAAAYPAPEQVTSALSDMTDALAASAGIDVAAMVSTVPLERGSSNGLIPEGRPFEMASTIDSDLRLATPGYFPAMRIRLIRGRTFTARDRSDAAKVMVINEALAQEAFPGQEALGKRIACCEAGPAGGPSFKEVVGIVADTRSHGLDHEPGPEFYLPMTQAPAAAWNWLDRGMTLVVRTAGDPGVAAAAMRQAVWSVDRTIPVFNIGTMDDRISGSLAESRFSTMLMSAFGATALLLAAIGVYGLISHGVAQRTWEIGVRMALGAEGRQVLTMVVRHGVALAAAGLAIGVAVALALTRLLGGMLFRVSPTDPPTFAVGVGVLAAVAILAAVLPARRAARVDPAVALRSE